MLMFARAYRYRWILVLGGAVATLAVAGAGYRGRVAASRPSIVLITLDTTRADRLGIYGYPRQTSPFIDSLAARGVLFTQAFVPMATTAPSHASMLTGLYPAQHQVLQNGDVLDEHLLSLAEWLHARGYQTAGFASTRTHFRTAGFGQGFDVFDEPPEDAPRARAGSVTISNAIEWLHRRDRQRPFLLWVHLFDAHLPHDPANRYPPHDAADGERLVRVLTVDQRVPIDFFGGSKGLLDLMTAYDGQLRALDRSVERLYRATEDLDGESLWIIANDHGEGLGSHHWMEHGRMLYNEQLRAVLILHFPDGRFAGRQVDCLVEHVDLFPTIADILGESLVHEPSLMGYSLLPAISGDRCPDRRYVLAQRRAFRNMPTNLGAFESGNKFALQDRRYKYILWTDGPHELYDLRQDPYETRNLVGAGLPVETDLRTALLDKLEGLAPVLPGRAGVVDAATMEQLRALGY
jgi:arylsulfatase A-like enzyme